MFVMERKKMMGFWRGKREKIKREKKNEKFVEEKKKEKNEFLKLFFWIVLLRFFG